MWDARNKVLHDTKAIHPLHGETEIDYRITVQLGLGRENLVPNDYHLINIDEEKLLTQKIEQKKE